MAKTNAGVFDWTENYYDIATSQDMHYKPHSAKYSLMRLLECRDRRHRGVALIWVAILLILLILFVGLSVDTAKVCLVAHQLQNAGDAAALAGACFVKIDQTKARQQAITIADKNRADSEAVFVADNISNMPDGDVVIGRYLRQTGVFRPTTDNVNAVKVVANRTDEHLQGNGTGGPVPLNFGPIAQVETVDVYRHAIAMSSGTTGAGLIALASNPPKGTGLLIKGSSIVNVINGDVQVNSVSESEPWTAFLADGGAFTLNCTELNVCGKISPEINQDDPSSYWASVEYSANENTAPIPDPLNNDEYKLPDLSPLPSMTKEWGNQTVKINSGDTYTLQPAYYPGGIEITGGNVTFVPGIYAIGGGNKKNNPTGLEISGDCTVTAEGVMLYITKSPQGVYGRVKITGNPNVVITPPEEGTYQGISIFQDRESLDNKGERVTAEIHGTAEFNLEGTLYFPESHVVLSGTDYVAGNQLIAYTVEVAGNSEVVIDYDGGNMIIGYMSYIVE